MRRCLISGGSQRVSCQRHLPLAASLSARCLVTYAENPARWQSDPAVQLYGKLLSVRQEEPEAFIVAASTLRQQTDLPLDLRASAGRMRASLLFQQAVQLYQGLQVANDKPWPTKAFDETLESVSLACKAYEEAVIDSADAELCKAIAPHCPEWSEALSQVKNAYVQARLLRAELRLWQVNWHARQGERARDAANLERREIVDPTRAADALEAVGLSRTVSEEELWRFAAEAAERLEEECPVDSVGTSEPEVPLRTRCLQSQALLAACLKNMAVTYGIKGNLEEAVVHLVRALGIRVEPADAFTPDLVEQLRAAAQGVLQLLSRELQNSETQSESKRWADLGWEIGQATTAFNAWRGES